MISLNSDYHHRLNKALYMALLENDFSIWEELIEERKSDGFINIIGSEEAMQELKKIGYSDLENLFFNIETFENQFRNPLSQYPGSAGLFYKLWYNLKRNVNDLLSSSRSTMNIPVTGGILVFIAGLSICLVVKFNRQNKTLKVVDVIKEPKSAFDFWGSITEADMTNRNILKEIISTGHKLIYHRGILIHIDKRKDHQVFGPSIDTLLLNEILIQELFENNIPIEEAIEIGCGNGLLTVSLAKYLDKIISLDTIDVNINAIFCAHKNLEANIPDNLLENINLTKINGFYNGVNISKKYDLIVCNPPYIPIPEADQHEHLKNVNYHTAVGGLELIQEVLNSLPLVLKENGMLFLLISNLSYDYVRNNLDPKFKIEEPLPNGLEVLFDVEAVFSNQRWFEFLKAESFLKEVEGVLYHTIHPLIIKFM